jgi:hypothetical protein
MSMVNTANGQANGSAGPRAQLRLPNGSNSASAARRGPPPLINPRLPHVALTQVFERTNKEGRRYLVGRMGAAKLLIVATEEISRGEKVWKVFLGEGPYASEGASEVEVA